MGDPKRRGGSIAAKRMTDLSDRPDKFSHSGTSYATQRDATAASVRARDAGRHKSKPKTKPREGGAYRAETRERKLNTQRERAMRGGPFKMPKAKAPERGTLMARTRADRPARTADKYEVNGTTYSNRADAERARRATRKVPPPPGRRR